MQVLVIDNGSSHLKKLVTLFANAEVKVIDRSDFKASLVAPGTLVVMSGARRGSASVLWHGNVYEQQLELIRKYDGPIIGICLGMQLIARAYDAPIQKRLRRIRGVVSIKRTQVPEAAVLPETFTGYEAHKFKVGSTTSTQLIELARSTGGVEVLRHRTKQIFGLQFHPEVKEPINEGKQVFELIMKEITS